MIEQIQIIALNCPNCRERLDLSAGRKSFACSRCGARQLIESDGGDVSLKLVAGATSEMRTDEVKAISSQTLRRFYDEMYTLLERRSQVNAEAVAEIKKYQASTMKALIAILCAGAFAWLIMFASDAQSISNFRPGLGFWIDAGVVSAACLAALIVRGSSVRLIREVLTREMEEFDSRIIKVQQEIARHEAIFES